MTAPRHFIDLWKLDGATLRLILEDAKARKTARKGWPQGRIDADAPAKDRVLSMIFQKNSTRTRFSFDAAMRQLGGDAIISTASDMQLGRGETIEDTAKVLSRMVDAVMIRANVHADVERFAQVSTVPVINGLTDKSHPCQIMADLLTIEEHRGDVGGKTIAWVGDGNNVCSSFIHAAPLLGFKLRIACPAVYHADLHDLARAAGLNGDVTMSEDPKEAVRGADVVVADTWVSMGDTDHDERLKAFEPYQVDDALMDLAKPDGVFLHCLPAHRGEEVTDAVLDGPRSLVWDEAENRIHAQKSVLAWCFGAIG
ncbi:ornithine carbamoyltransferase [Caulobacter endophyticus]|uniref:Ornithine carbamoyltransferase n=1 Tax=Caulobacter endophyticus TaxID=2172652 RepID=A0A2T9K685_9CAUL|nr:ornithine carbamoyltransferase [Caulobacter endophyticus]PVM91464.1 ornithine carbamoyltransferase [Caulobacter endophyticus]